MAGWRDVPALLRHCVCAVYSKSTGGGADGVVRAFKICRDKLAQQGYLYHRGSSQILEGIVLTGKGYVRNLDHSREGFEGDAKDQQFQQLFQMIEPRLYEYDGPGGKQPPKSLPSASGDAQDDERVHLTSSPEVQIVPNVDDWVYPDNGIRKK